MVRSPSGPNRPRTGLTALKARVKVRGLAAIDRATKMMVRNLKAIKELRQGPTPAVTVGKAQQVNVAERQVNAVGA